MLNKNGIIIHEVMIMSRDFTPREFHKVDLMYKFSQQDMKVYDCDGTEHIVYKHDTPMAIRLPNLHFLFDLLAKVNWTEKELNKLDGIEKELANIIDNDTKNDTVLSKWYWGELDKNFYYNTRNNELLLEWIKGDKNEF